ncbi:MAG: hypothetical protein AAGJ46_14425 [Planctomycetota bacterium]
MATLFNLENAGCEVRTAHDLADLIAGLSEFQELAEATDTEEARESLKIGPEEDALKDGEISGARLAQRHLWSWIMPPDDSLTVGDGETNTSPEMVGGEFHFVLRRPLRPAEDYNDAFVWFWDITSRLLESLKAATRGVGSLRLGQAVRTAPPHYPLRKQGVAQNDFLTVEFSIPWGDA